MSWLFTNLVSTLLLPPLSLLLLAGVGLGVSRWHPRWGHGLLTSALLLLWLCATPYFAEGVSLNLSAALGDLTEALLPHEKLVYELLWNGVFGHELRGVEKTEGEAPVLQALRMFVGMGAVERVSG